METKKTIAADLTRQDTLFFSIGLVISLIFVIIIFEWKTVDRNNILSLNRTDDMNVTDLIEIPPTTQPPPPPPIKQQVRIVEVPDYEEILETVELDLDVEITEETRIEEYVYEIEEEVVEEIFTIVEEQPSPIGGYASFYLEVGKRLNYPGYAVRNQVEGKVFVEFIVNQAGQLTEVKVVKGIGAGCDEEAVRVIESMPNWNPGKQRGKAVKVRMIIPILFEIKYQ